jgi:hypothetical protein
VTQRTEPTELETALIAGLAITADKLTTAALDLKDATRFTRTMRVVVAVGMALLVGLTVIALQNRANGKAVRTNTASIRDCTSPGGGCYERGRQSTGQAVAQIVAAVNAHTDLVYVATLECAHRLHHSDAAFERCLHAKGVR